MLVVDASMSLAWCFGDEATEFSRSLQLRVYRHGARAPSHWIAEVANGLLMAEQYGRSTPLETATSLRLLESMPIRVDDRPTRFHARAIIALAVAHNLTAYDAAYLEYALRLGVPLVTLDRRLQHAAVAAGVELILS